MENAVNPIELNLSGASPRAMADRKHYFQLAQLAQSPTELVEVIMKVLDSPTVFVFGEILDLASVKSLQGTTFEPYLRLLKVFAYDTYKMYRMQKEAQPESLPDLTPVMITKLRQLSIVSLTRTARIIPYEAMLKELEIDSVRQLEDLIIESIYANLLKGVMDQRKACLEVEETMGRDVREEDYHSIVGFLSQWLQDCDKVLVNLEQQMTTATRQKEEHLQEKKQNELKQQALIKKLANNKESAESRDPINNLIRRAIEKNVDSPVANSKLPFRKPKAQRKMNN